MRRRPPAKRDAGGGRGKEKGQAAQKAAQQAAKADQPLDRMPGLPSPSDPKGARAMALQVVNDQIADRADLDEEEAAERRTLSRLLSRSTQYARAVINLRKRGIVHPLHEHTPATPHEPPTALSADGVERKRRTTRPSVVSRRRSSSGSKAVKEALGGSTNARAPAPAVEGWDEMRARDHVAWARCQLLEAEAGLRRSLALREQRCRRCIGRWLAADLRASTEPVKRQAIEALEKAKRGPLEDTCLEVHLAFLRRLTARLWQLVDDDQRKAETRLEGLLAHYQETCRVWHVHDRVVAADASLTAF
ncbi:hypothetical protein DIPPA_24239 [Diplonema papillatum]|nr:hypothetical protein DIPPA_24239 [Diplonema papillatum]